MSTYFKYAEQSANSQVNWADVSKNVSEMLKTEVDLREKKKAAYEESFQKLNDTLANAPQGKWQDGNRFTNDAAHDLSQQNLMNYRLFKSGQMNERDYTFGRQNLQNGTNTVFSLTNAFNAAYDDRMQGLLTNKYQALTGANMQQVEGFKNFSNSKVVIDPYTSQLSIGKMAKNPTTGVMELTKDVVPANVLMGMIGTPIPAWDSDASINDIVGKIGKNEEILYNAASTTRAGTITKLLGLGALQGEYAKVGEDGKPLYPQFKDSIDNINKGLNDAISSAFSNPYNISSVLTQNLGGKYKQDSFTYDKNVAANDKGKILLKIDNTSGLPTLDTTSPNYKAQEQEARDYVKGQMLLKMDSKRDMTTTGTTPYGPQASEAAIIRKEGETDKLAVAGAWNGLYTGKTASEKRDYADILLGTPLAKKEGLLKIDLTDPNKVKLVYDNPKKDRTISMVTVDGDPISLDNFSAKGVELHEVSDRRKAMAAGGGGTSYGILDDYSSVFSERKGETEKPAKAVALPVDLFSIKSEKSAKLLQSILPSGFIVRDNGGPFGNEVLVKAPNGKTYSYNANEKESVRNSEKLLLDKFIKDNTSTTRKSSGTTTVTGGRVR